MYERRVVSSHRRSSSEACQCAEWKLSVKLVERMVKSAASPPVCVVSAVFEPAVLLKTYSCKVRPI